MSRWLKTLVIVEVLVCFGPATLALILGIVVAPWHVRFLVTASREAIPESLYIMGAVVAGAAGFGALAHVLWHLFAGTPIKRLTLVVAAVLAALFPLPFVMLKGDTVLFRILAALPFAGAAHILYLSRRLFAQRS